MTIKQKQEVANSFTLFQRFNLDIEISAKEFDIFDKGVYAQSMDEKWNIFVLDNFMYWCRSWTGYCIYKIEVERGITTIKLKTGFINREKTQYKSEDLEGDRVLFLQILQIYLDRDDLYVDPEFEYEGIKQVIQANDPYGKIKKRIGHNTAGLTRQIYDGLSTEEQKQYIDIFGWENLKQNIADIPDEEPLLSLQMNNTGSTYYFDKEGKVLLGETSMKSKLKA